MIVKTFAESIVLGSLMEHNKESVLLRKKQIEEGVSIHTCNDYGESLEIIRDASNQAGKAPKIISKVYYRYPNSRHRRFRPIIDQLNETKRRLASRPKRWMIQLCCQCNPENLKNGSGRKFIEQISTEFNISKLYFENYPNYNLDLNEVHNLNIIYENIFSFGVLGYQNLERRIFNNSELRMCKDKDIDLCFMGFLGLGNKDKTLGIFNNLGYSLSKKEKILLNMAYLMYGIKFNFCSFGITSVSSYEQYESLKEIFEELVNDKCSIILENFLEHLIVLNPYDFKNFDQYKIRYKQIESIPKRFAFAIFNALMHSKINRSIGNGFI